MKETHFIAAGWEDFLVNSPTLQGCGDEPVLVTPALLSKLNEMAYYAGAHRALMSTYTAGGKLEMVDGEKARVYEAEDMRKLMGVLESNMHEVIKKAREYRLLFSEAAGESVN